MQSEAVSRCRNVKEVKLKAKFQVLKLADEEGNSLSFNVQTLVIHLTFDSSSTTTFEIVTIFNDNLNEAFYIHRAQLISQNQLQIREEQESKDTLTASLRKQRLSILIDKVSALKLQSRFLEEECGRYMRFKEMTRQKREAFQVRLSRLEQRQVMERYVTVQMV
jgi:hypothetical protein